MMQAIVVRCPRCGEALDILVKALDFVNVSHPITVDALCPQCRDLFRVTVSVEEKVERPGSIMVNGEGS
jgi:uncharacterized C2H2 Zn-finger protein